MCYKLQSQTGLWSGWVERAQFNGQCPLDISLYAYMQYVVLYMQYRNNAQSIVITFFGKKLAKKMENLLTPPLCILNTTRREPVQSGSQNPLLTLKSVGESDQAPVCLMLSPSSVCAEGCYGRGRGKVLEEGQQTRQHCRLSIWVVKTNTIQVITKQTARSK